MSTGNVQADAAQARVEQGQPEPHFCHSKVQEGEVRVQGKEGLCQTLKG